MNPDGNERLTAAVGVLALAPVLVEVATVLLGVHTFMSWHVFVGLVLIPVRSTAGDVLPAERPPVAGKTTRLYALATAVVCGLVLGGALRARPAPLGRPAA